MEFPLKSRNRLPYDPAIPLLNIYLKKVIIQKDTCTPMFTTALFTIAKTWKQPRCPSTEEWIKKMWYINTMKYSAALYVLSNVGLSVNPLTVAHQALPCTELTRQEQCSGLPFPSPGDLANLGIKPGSPMLQADSLPSESPGKPSEQLVWFDFLFLTSSSHCGFSLFNSGHW